MASHSRRAVLGGLGAVCAGSVLESRVINASSCTHPPKPPGKISPAPGSMMVLFEGPWILGTDDGKQLIALAADTADHTHWWGSWDQTTCAPSTFLDYGHRPAILSPTRAAPGQPSTFNGLFEAAFCDNPFTYLHSRDGAGGVLALAKTKAAVCIHLALPDQVDTAVVAKLNGTTNHDSTFDHHPVEKGRGPLTFALTYNNTQSITIDGKTIEDPVVYFTVRFNEYRCAKDQMCLDLHQRVAFDDLRRLVTKKDGTMLQISSEPTEDYDPVSRPCGLNDAQLGIDNKLSPGSPCGAMNNHRLASCAHGGFVLGA